MTAQVRKLIAQAGAQLDSGDTAEALISLLKAKISFYDIGWKIEHLLGICYRLRGEFEESEAAFDRALKRLPKESDLDRARIVRDKSMLSLVQGDYATAEEQLETSRYLLSQDEEVPHEPNSRVEYFVTIGFVGRLRGQQGDVLAARECFAAANAELRGRAPYELNNLVWWLSNETPSVRCKLGCRALRLAFAAKNRARVLQVIALTASPRLARRFGS